MKLNQVTLPSFDISQSREFYLRLGFTLIVDSKHYLRFFCEDGGSTFSLHQTDISEVNGSVFYFETEELDELYLDLCKKGFEFESEPTDQVWAWREARLRDPSGNQICFYYAGENRVNPPWRVTIRD